MEIYNIDFNENTPIYIQLANRIKHLINSNTLKNREKLPSIRQLSSRLKVNNVTVKSAYKKLMEEGYVEIIQGSGTYVRKIIFNGKLIKDYKETLKKITPQTKEIYMDFAKESLNSDYFPIKRFKETVTQVLDSLGAHELLYEETLGYMPLRKIISDRFWGGSIDKDNILILSGAQQGIDLASKVLINIGSNVIVEKPTYTGALNVFKWRRANIYDIEIDEFGIRIDKLEALLKKKKIEIVYLMTYFQNPTGVCYSDSYKERLLYLANKYDFYIVEDDYLSELVYSKTIKHETIKSMDIYHRVIYIKSFSKIFLPGIRLGYLISPPKLKDIFQNYKINTDVSTSSLMQRTLKLYIEKGYWKEHINNINIIYEKKHNLMIKLMDKYFKDIIHFMDPKGGLSFYLNLNQKVKIETDQLFYKLKKDNIIITPGSVYYKDLEEGLKSFKLSYSVINDREMEKGIVAIRDKILEGC